MGHADGIGSDQMHLCTNGEPHMNSYGHTTNGEPKVGSVYKQLKLAKAGECQRDGVLTETWGQIWKMEETLKVRGIYVETTR